MRQNYNFILSFACLIFVTTSKPLCAEQILIEDQNGQPLSNAVVEIVDPSTKITPNTETVVIDQVNKRFSPYLMVVQRGQIIDFPNSDNIRHHVYSFSKANIFELKLYADRPEKPVTFDNHGVVVLGCNIHDTMLGYIYVADMNKSYVSGENGVVELPDLSTDTQVIVWHANQKQGPEYLDQSELGAILKVIPDSISKIVIETGLPSSRNSFGDVFDSFH